jgi:beta-xylosidase
MKLLLAVYLSIASFAQAPAQPSPTPLRAIRPGEMWPDNRGLHVQAHGGGIIKLGDTYYWFGEQRSPELDKSKRYVSCYSSKDLSNWVFHRNVVELTDPVNVGERWVLERPKVFHNTKTKKFVMYVHLDGPIPLAGETANRAGGSYAVARVAVLTSDKVDGDYIYSRSFRPLGHESRDIGQFIDDDGTPYLVFEDRSFGFRIASLSADYLSVEKEVCLIAAHMEGGAIVHHQGL